jgi:hypothetical protein
MKKLIISESEKRRILEMYNLITEQVEQELVNYGNNYIDNNDCDKIYNDLKNFQSAVESGQVQMSSEDKKELDKNLKRMNILKKVACDTIKEQMKENFAEQAQQNPDKLKVSMCWFSENISKPSTPLKACSVTAQPGDETPAQTSTEQPAQTSTEQPAQTSTEQPAQTSTEQPAQTGDKVDSNYKLDTPDKIQKFQTWMDKNHGKWAYSRKYNRNYSVDGKSNKGFGNMGPNTKKAWDNTEFKNAYLKEMGLVNKTENKPENKTNVEQPKKEVQQSRTEDDAYNY